MKIKIHVLPFILFLITIFSTAFGSGVAIFKEQSFHSDESANPIFYKVIVMTNPVFVKLVANNKEFTIERKNFVGNIDLMPLPGSITKEENMTHIRKHAGDLKAFTKRFPKSQPLLKLHMASIQECINKFDSGYVYYSGAWLMRSEYEVAEKKNAEIAAQSEKERRVRDEKEAKINKAKMEEDPFAVDSSHAANVANKNTQRNQDPDENVNLLQKKWSFKDEANLAAMEAKMAADHSEGLIKFSNNAMVEARKSDDILKARNDLTVEIASEEKELTVAIRVASLGSEESRKEYDLLANKIVLAGSDPEKLRQARSALANYVVKKTGKTVGAFDLDELIGNKGIGEELVRHARRILASRSRMLVRETLKENATMLGVGEKDAESIGYVFVNLSTDHQVGLFNVLRSENVEELKAYVEKELSPILKNFQIDSNMFTQRIYQFRSKEGRDKLNKMAISCEIIAHFIPLEVRKQAEELYISVK